MLRAPRLFMRNCQRGLPNDYWNEEVVVVQGRMTKGEKILEALAFLLVVVAMIARCVIDVEDIGVLVIMAFVAFWFYVIMLVCAFVPADWRLTTKQKAEIVDPVAYQTKYRRIMVGVNLIASIIFSIIIMKI